MTALAGFWAFEDRPDIQQKCGRMLNAQAMYGTGQPTFAASAGIAVGRRLSPLLPEDRFDRGPIRGGGGHLLLAADVRLDNRDDLARDLAMAPHEAGLLCDSAMLMKAWEHWQEGALERIVGDFAFALWDARDCRLLLARDFLGQRPIHFARGSNSFCFASMPQGLHALPEIPYELDSEALLGFAALAPETGSRTFFRGIERVEPGHFLTVSRKGISSTCYWNPSLRPLRLRNRTEYVEAVRESLDQAVASRLRGSEDRAGAHLSGGLDSAGVAATAARLLPAGACLTAFTAVPQRSFMPSATSRIEDEGPLAAATAALYPNIAHVLVAGEDRSPLAAIERTFHLYQRPLPNPCNAVWWDAIMDAAKERGIAVLLNAQLGNLSFSASGLDSLPQLLTTGRLVRFGREAVRLLHNGLGSRALAVQTLAPFLPPSIWRALARWRGLPHRMSDFSFAAVQPTDPEACHGLDYASQPPLNGPEARLRALRWCDFGNFNKGALAGWGIEMRDPTSDRRLVELSLRIPVEEFLVGGLPRGLARRALGDRLPASVLQERRRGYQGADWFERMTADLNGIRDEMARIEGCAAAGVALDLGRMRRTVEQWPETKSDRRKSEAIYRRALLRGLSAGHFARKVAGSNA